jgi:hypothetical protein
MFEEMVVSSPKGKKTNKPWTVALSMILQVAFLSVLILIPLIYTEALPKASLGMLLIAPPPPPPPPPPPAAAPVVHVKPQAHLMDAGKLVAPKAIPKEVKIIKEDAEPDPGMMANGMLAGLVAITPAAGFVGPMSALLIGLSAGVFCYFMVVTVKAKFGYDDSLDAFGVHGAGGTLGALLTGVFASSAVNPIFRDAHGNVLASGVVEGNPRQLLNQLIGVAIAWVIAIVGTLLILKFVDWTIGLRVTAEHEIQGLDLSQHGEEGYYWDVSR